VPADVVGFGTVELQLVFSQSLDHQVLFVQSALVLDPLLELQCLSIRNLPAQSLEFFSQGCVLVDQAVLGLLVVLCAFDELSGGHLDPVSFFIAHVFELGVVGQ